MGRKEEGGGAHKVFLVMGSVPGKNFEPLKASFELHLGQLPSK